MTTEERLEKLEKESAAAKRQVRRLKIGGAVALACVTVLLALWARPAEVQARKFVLMDEAGKIRAVLAMEDFGPRLGLSDAQGKTRAELCIMKTGPELNLFGMTGATRAGISVLKDGPMLDLEYENSKSRALLAAEEGGPGIRLYEGNDKIVWSAP